MSSTTATAVASEPLATASKMPPGLRRSLTLICFGFFVSSLVDPQTLGLLPLQFLLKNHLHRTPTQMATFFALGAFAWYLKPLAGLLADSVPLFRTRRRYYLLFGAALAAVGWLLVWLLSPTYSLLLTATVFLGTMLMLLSTVLGGLVVSEGRAYGATGRVNSFREIAMDSTSLLAGPVGGFLAAQAFGWTAALCAGFLLSLFLMVFLTLREPPTARVDRQVWSVMRGQLQTLLRSGPLWAAAGMIFLLMVTPGFTTPLFYYQTDTLHFSSQFIGNLQFLSGVGAVLGSGVYMLLCRRFPLRGMLTLGIVASTASALLFLAYRSHLAAIYIESINGLAGVLVLVAMMDLAARATPRGCESLGYALMMSVYNLGASLSDVGGSWLLDHYHLPFLHLVWINAATTALTLIAVPFLPRLLLDRSDGEAVVSE